MEASIRDANIKHFVRLLQCASRFGDDLCIHARDTKWELAVTNSSKSAYSRFTLEPAFFSRYRPLGNKVQQAKGIKCQLYVRSVLSVLGKASSVNAVERVDLKIVDPEGGLRASTQHEDESDNDDIRVSSRSAYLELKLVYRHGVTKKHHLHLQPSDCLRAEVDPDSTPSGFLISAKVLRDWLDHFTIAFGSGTGTNVRGDSHLAWLFSVNEVRVKNFETATTSTLSTEIKIDVNEFQHYEVYADRVDLALPMREFKATLQLAEQLNMDLDFAFSEASQPMTMMSRFIGLDKYGNETELFDIFCAIATTPTQAFPAEANGAANGSSRQRSESAAVKREDPRRSESARPTARAASSRPSARPRASLSMIAQDRDTTAPEALFQPGPSQSSQGVRMTQQEVLELAGMGDLDMEALMGDDDTDMAMEPTTPPTIPPTIAMPTDVPAGWEEMDADFADVSTQRMSTQRDAIAAAQEAQSDPRVSEISAASIKRSESSAEFKPNPEILQFPSREREDSNGTEVDAEEELDEDAFDPTQPSGHKFEQLFQD